MSTTITIPKDYGYVIATTAFTFFLGLWHGARARPLRLKAKVWAPKHFAEASDIAAASPEQQKLMYLFNCAQRAHGNYVENHPSTAIALLISGLQYPRLATGLGWLWITGRVIFAMGYTSANKSDASGRIVGFAIQLPGQIGLWLLTAWTGISIARA